MVVCFGASAQQPLTGPSKLLVALAQRLNLFRGWWGRGSWEVYEKNMGEKMRVESR